MDRCPRNPGCVRLCWLAQLSPTATVGLTAGLPSGAGLLTAATASIVAASQLLTCPDASIKPYSPWLHISLTTPFSLMHNYDNIRNWNSLRLSVFNGINMWSVLSSSFQRILTSDGIDSGKYWQLYRTHIACTRVCHTILWFPIRLPDVSSYVLIFELFNFICHTDFIL